MFTAEKGERAELDNKMRTKNNKRRAHKCDIMRNRWVLSFVVVKGSCREVGRNDWMRDDDEEET